ncbi:hypothetical protein IAQ61_002845 [Plenodomus lingam]|uniref:uncharacterized protein n=1 Tax=Leptosphaeria maculans TaxID=5022 RepID=UPI003326B42D|nr:hypothetical protein IAQ61_002845 [Plenodomus lingam]
MKLKRPSNANDYDSLADFDGEGNVSTSNTASRRSYCAHCGVQKRLTVSYLVITWNAAIIDSSRARRIYGR